RRRRRRTTADAGGAGEGRGAAEGSQTSRGPPARGACRLMPRSNVARGAYYKGRTRKWLIEMGWQVADLEVIRYVGAGIPVKRDQFGADLLAVSAKRLLFVQVKSGKHAL